MASSRLPLLNSTFPSTDAWKAQVYEFCYLTGTRLGTTSSRKNSEYFLRCPLAGVGKCSCACAVRQVADSDPPIFEVIESEEAHTCKGKRRLKERSRARMFAKKKLEELGIAIPPLPPPATPSSTLVVDDTDSDTSSGSYVDETFDDDELSTAPAPSSSTSAARTRPPRRAGRQAARGIERGIRSSRGRRDSSSMASSFEEASSEDEVETQDSEDANSEKEQRRKEELEFRSMDELKKGIATRDKVGRVPTPRISDSFSSLTDFLLTCYTYAHQRGFRLIRRPGRKAGMTTAGLECGRRRKDRCTCIFKATKQDDGRWTVSEARTRHAHDDGAGPKKATQGLSTRHRQSSIFRTIRSFSPSAPLPSPSNAQLPTRLDHLDPDYRPHPAPNPFHLLTPEPLNLAAFLAGASSFSSPPIPLVNHFLSSLDLRTTADLATLLLFETETLFDLVLHFVTSEAKAGRLVDAEEAEAVAAWLLEAKQAHLARTYATLSTALVPLRPSPSFRPDLVLLVQGQLDRPLPAPGAPTLPRMERLSNALPPEPPRGASDEAMEARTDERVEVGAGEVVQKRPLGEASTVRVVEATSKSDGASASASDLNQQLSRHVAIQNFEDDMSIDSDLDSLSSADTDIANAAVLPSSRLTLLFPEDEDKAFSSPKSFFNACKARLLRTYGVPTHVGHDTPRYAVATCGRRWNLKCKMSIRAERGMDGRWRVNRKRSRFDHSHDAEEIVMEVSEAETSTDDEESTDGEDGREPLRGRGDEHYVEESTSESSDDEDDPAMPRDPGASSRPAGWNAWTRSPIMLQLVHGRDAIFSQQRTSRNDARQDRCHKLMQDYFSTLSSANTVPRGSFAQYETFCADNDIPPFPITAPLVALALFAKCSVKNGHYSTYKGDLLRFGRSTERVWEDDVEYVKLAGRQGVEGAIEEFLYERRNVRLRARPKKRSREALASTSSTGKEAKRRTRSPRKKSSTRPSETIVLSSDDSGSTTSDEGSEESDGDAAASHGTVSIPNLPAPSDTFDSLKALYLAYVKALVPSMGISVQLGKQTPTTATVKCNRNHIGRYNPHCPYELTAYVDDQTGRWQVDEAASSMEHNHGPAKQILADPKWRPMIRNADARTALGLHAMPSSTKPLPTKKDRKKNRDESKAEKRRFPTTTSASGSASPSTSSTRFTPGAVAPQPPPPLDHPFPPTFAPSGPLALPQQYQSPSLAYSSSSTFFQPPQPAYQSQPAYPAQQKPAYSLPLPASTFPSAHLTSSASSAPLSPAHLAAFLTSLHSSLAPLAPNLAAFGFSTLDSLVALTLLEPESVDALVEQMRALSETEQTRPPGGARMSLIQGKLLVKGLREAAASMSGSGSASGPR
ncbi:hypothetical protein JCM8097_003775 [Rhodosporidiobolus ruineniae]